MGWGEAVNVSGGPSGVQMGGDILLLLLLRIAAGLHAAPYQCHISATSHGASSLIHLLILNLQQRAVQCQAAWLSQVTGQDACPPGCK